MEVSETGPGRRERKRRETRAALIVAALDLFEERGIAATTIDDITDRADVARRTFFRHFSSKEAVLLPDPEEYEHLIATALDAEARPLTMTRLLAIFAAAAQAFQAEESTKRRQARIIAAHRLELGSVAWTAFMATRDALVGRLATHTGADRTDVRLHLAANLALFTISTAYVRWTEDGGASLTEHLDATVAELRDLVNDRITLEVIGQDAGGSGVRRRITHRTS